MGQAKSIAVRQQIIQLKQSGQTHAQVSEALHIGIGTVQNIWKRYRAGGEAALCVSYERCGLRVKQVDEIAFRLVRLIKHLHPSWGVPLILLKVSEKYPTLRLRSIRQYQRRIFSSSGKLPTSILPPPIPVDQSRIAHDSWQIDAKERFSMQNGVETCYLTVVDEGTGALLAARAFPPRKDFTGAVGRDSFIFD
ncbi:MAG: helix-turn-helix domain-containing protein [Saprospiraceae bacterium]|nr:helix-turn-helix domain-containing protein [Saprospiraceae bacterium]